MSVKNKAGHTTTSSENATLKFRQNNSNVKKGTDTSNINHANSNTSNKPKPDRLVFAEAAEDGDGCQVVLKTVSKNVVLSIAEVEEQIRNGTIKIVSSPADATSQHSICHPKTRIHVTVDSTKAANGGKLLKMKKQMKMKNANKEAGVDFCVNMDFVKSTSEFAAPFLNVIYKSEDAVESLKKSNVVKQWVLAREVDFTAKEAALPQDAYSKLADHVNEEYSHPARAAKSKEQHFAQWDKIVKETYEINCSTSRDDSTRNNKTSLTFSWESSVHQKIANFSSASRSSCKSTLKPEAESVIPETVFQTCDGPDCDRQFVPPYVFEQFGQFGDNDGNNSTDINRDFSYNLYDDAEGLLFLQTLFPPEFAHRFQNFGLGAHKADLLRYCLLYVFGGYYFDIKLLLKPGLKMRDIFYKHNEKDNKNNTKKKKIFYSALGGADSRTIYQALLASPAGNPYLAALIDRMVSIPVDPSVAKEKRFDVRDALLPYPLTISHFYDLVQDGMTEWNQAQEQTVPLIPNPLNTRRSDYEQMNDHHSHWRYKFDEKTGRWGKEHVDEYIWPRAGLNVLGEKGDWAINIFEEMNETHWPRSLGQWQDSQESIKDSKIESIKDSSDFLHALYSYPRDTLVSAYKAFAPLVFIGTNFQDRWLSANVLRDEHGDVKLIARDPKYPYNATRFRDRYVQQWKGAYSCCGCFRTSRLLQLYFFNMMEFSSQLVIGHRPPILVKTAPIMVELDCGLENARLKTDAVAAEEKRILQIENKVSEAENSIKRLRNEKANMQANNIHLVNVEIFESKEKSIISTEKSYHEMKEHLQSLKSNLHNNSRLQVFFGGANITDAILKQKGSKTTPYTQKELIDVDAGRLTFELEYAPLQLHDKILGFTCPGKNSEFIEEINKSSPNNQQNATQKKSTRAITLKMSNSSLQDLQLNNNSINTSAIPWIHAGSRYAMEEFEDGAGVYLRNVDNSGKDAEYERTTFEHVGSWISENHFRGRNYNPGKAGWTQVFSEEESVVNGTITDESASSSGTPSNVDKNSQEYESYITTPIISAQVDASSSYQIRVQRPRVFDSLGRSGMLSVVDVFVDAMTDADAASGGLFNLLGFRAGTIILFDIGFRMCLFV